MHFHLAAYSLNRRIATILVVLTLQTTSLSVFADSNTPESSLEVRRVDIIRNNIFPATQTRQFILPRLINRFHTVTRHSVISREIWFKKGDHLSHEDLGELERILRNLDLFAEVTVSAKPVNSAEPGTSHQLVDIVVTTSDRLSIVASTGGSYLGGIGEVSFSIGEKNLFGLGHAIEFGYRENTAGELLGSFAYDNVRPFGGEAIASVRFGQTEEGNSYGIRLRNEFSNSSDTLSWLFTYDRSETRIDFFENGESIIEVPRETEKFTARRLYRTGHSDQFLRFGPLLEYRTTDYSPAQGSQSDSIEVPDDETALFMGALVGYDAVSGYKKINWLDTLDYDQDLSFGHGIEFALGATDAQTQQDQVVKPVVFSRLWWRKSINAHELLSTNLNTTYQWEKQQDNTWDVSTRLRLYSTRFEQFTLASSLRYATAFNDSGLPVQQNLGEDNGLRGYPAREFNGEQSLLLNLESRWITPIQLLTFRLGAVLFSDFGWVGDRESTEFFSDVHASAGVGLRVGSPKILGSSVVRLDLAFPFDDDPERNYKPQFSLSTGQVFRF